jgi:hypothetical protein
MNVNRKFERLYIKGTWTSTLVPGVHLPPADSGSRQVDRECARVCPVLKMFFTSPVFFKVDIFLW